MRENTRCEVEEPISTPTLSTTTSSSSTSERPVLEKKIRPPCASSSAIMPGAPCSRARELGYDGAFLVEFGVHSARHPFRLELCLVLGADEGIFHPVWDRAAPFGDIHRGVVGVLLAGRAGLATRIMRPEPGGQAQRLLRRPEVLVVPARAAGRSRHHANRLVVDAPDLVGLTVLPRSDAASFRPGIGVALSFETNQHRGRGVRVRLGVTAVLVLPDPEVKGVARHERLDSPPARRAAVDERQVAIDDIGDEIRAPHRESAHRIGFDVILVLIEVVGAAEAVAELVWAVEHQLDIVDQVDQVGRRGSAEKQRRRRARVDDPMPGVDRNREQRTFLPFEDVPLAIVVEPHLGGAAALDDEIDLFVEVLFRFERVGARHLDDVGAPFALGAVELDIRAFPAQPLPWRKRQILHLAHADIAIDGNALRFHEQVVGRLGPAERAETGSVVAGRLMPVRPAGQFMHRDAFSRSKQSARGALLPAPQQGKAAALVALGRAADGGTKRHAERAFDACADQIRSPQFPPWRMDMKRILMGTVALLALGTAPALAQQPLKLGFISTFSGPVPAIGNDMRNSFELGLDHLGRKLGGRPVEVIYEDDQLKPEVGVQKTQKLIESDKVDFVVGYIWSNVLLASLKPLIDSKTSTIVTNAGASQLAVEMCSPYVFSTSWNI